MLWAGLLLSAPVCLTAQSPLSQSDLYCAGFITDRTLQTGLNILGSEDGGFKNEFTAGDYVYVNRGRDTINGTGGQYTIIRPVVDVNAREAFVGQREMIRELGMLYTEVGRLEVSVVHEQTSTARIVMSCDTVLAGDILVPFNNRTPPPFKTPQMTARFVPPTGKAAGLIVAAKEYDAWVGEGKIVYLNLGSNQGVQPGSYFYVTRAYLQGGNATFAEASREFLTDFNGSPMGRKLTPQEEATLPREVLGEVMVLSAEEGTATGIVTYSRSEIAVGDSVELE
jgi:hypothetical protein